MILCLSHYIGEILGSIVLMQYVQYTALPFLHLLYIDSMKWDEWNELEISTFSVEFIDIDYRSSTRYQFVDYRSSTRYQFIDYRSSTRYAAIEF